MHTLSACGTSPQLLILPVPRGFGKPGGSTQRPEPLPPLLGGVNLPFAQPKIVADFVPHRIHHDPFQVRRIPRHLFMRPLENTDPVRTLQADVRSGALRDRTALIQSQQIGRRPNRLHNDHQIAHPRAKPAGNIGDRAFHDRVKGFGCDT